MGGMVITGGGTTMISKNGTVITITSTHTLDEVIAAYPADFVATGRAVQIQDATLTDIRVGDGADTPSTLTMVDKQLDATGAVTLTVNGFSVAGIELTNLKIGEVDANGNPTQGCVLSDRIDLRLIIGHLYVYGSDIRRGKGFQSHGKITAEGSTFRGFVFTLASVKRLVGCVIYPADSAVNFYGEGSFPLCGDADATITDSSLVIDDSKNYWINRQFTRDLSRLQIEGANANTALFTVDGDASGLINFPDITLPQVVWSGNAWDIKRLNQLRQIDISLRDTAGTVLDGTAVTGVTLTDTLGTVYAGTQQPDLSWRFSAVLNHRITKVVSIGVITDEAFGPFVLHATMVSGSFTATFADLNEVWRTPVPIVVTNPSAVPQVARISQVDTHEFQGETHHEIVFVGVPGVSPTLRIWDTEVSPAAQIGTTITMGEPRPGVFKALINWSTLALPRVPDYYLIEVVQGNTVDAVPVEVETDPAANQAAAAVWASPSRTLTQSVGATPAEIWAHPNRLVTNTELSLIPKIGVDSGFSAAIGGGRWIIENNQMVFFAPDNVTEVARFNLYDSGGAPTTDPARSMQRVRV